MHVLGVIYVKGIFFLFQSDIHPRDSRKQLPLFNDAFSLDNLEDKWNNRSRRANMNELEAMRKQSYGALSHNLAFSLAD